VRLTIRRFEADDVTDTVRTANILDAFGGAVCNGGRIECSHRLGVDDLTQALKMGALTSHRPDEPIAYRLAFLAGPKSKIQFNGVRGLRTHISLRASQFVFQSKAMTEVITALCVFFSISIFLAHAVDAVRARWEDSSL
jgi:hypothetical protein